RRGGGLAAQRIADGEHVAQTASLPASAAISPDLRHSLTLAALGVVYGDIGTSPLYAVRQSLVEFADTSVPSILGTLSLIVWTLAVLSAVEGLKVATPLFEPYIIPISLVLLTALFIVQRRGTAAIGGLFGPIMVVWFAVLAVLGIWSIARQPHILLAVNPYYGLALLVRYPWHGFLMLGAVFLAVTGAEALYADMGHFGRRALRRAWLGLVFPALLLNYFGQGAVLLNNPAALENPFYKTSPEWALLPLVILASIATIIASQAVISGAFSLTRQAVQLGYLPRLEVRHTSATEIGQVYVPPINWGLLLAVIILVLFFRSSDNLGAAYGIAVSGMMLITTGLAFLYMRAHGWSLAVAVPVFALFALVDLTFLSANMLKI